MTYPFIQAAHFTPVAQRKIDLIVVHDMEAPEKPGTARGVAVWFAGPTAPQASAHYAIDATETIQCVQDHDVAWHAPGANNNGIGLEHAGYASQSFTDWEDAFSLAMLRRSAALTAELCRRYGIPMIWLEAADLLAGARGVTTHDAVSKAFKKSSHFDPGVGFPAADYLALVHQAALAALK